MDASGGLPRPAAGPGRWVRGLGLVRPGPTERFRRRTEVFPRDGRAEGIDVLLTPADTGPPPADTGPPPAVTGPPPAVRLVGPPGAERRLLWLAGELERRRPWRRHAPAFDPLVSPAAAAV